MTIYLNDIQYPRDAIVDTGASVSIVGLFAIKDIPHQMMSAGNSKLMGVQENRLTALGRVKLIVRLGQRSWGHLFYVLDDTACEM